jgi:hypothetical protein
VTFAFPVAHRETNTKVRVRSYSQSGMATSWMGS